MKKIKKTITTFLSLLMAVSLSAAPLFGCGEKEEPSPTASSSSESSEEEKEEGEGGDEGDGSGDDSGDEQQPDPPKLPPDEPTGEDNFTPVFRMVVYSDIHLTNNNPDSTKNFTEAIQKSYTWAEEQTYTGIDAFAMTGDLTHVGGQEPAMFAQYKSILDSKVKNGAPVISVLGNHDVYESNDKTVKGAEEYVKAGLKLDDSVTVKGFQLIGLSTSDQNGTFTDDQISYLETELAKANAADPEKPIFTFQHQKIEDTVYGCSGWNSARSSDKLDGAYSKYSQVINFSGHSHTSAASPRSVHQDKYTTVDVGALAGVSMDQADRFTDLGKNAFTNQTLSGKENLYGRIVEVDGENRVRIRAFCPFTGKTATTPATTDEAEKELVFRIDDVTDPDSFYYTDGRRYKAEEPSFAAGSAIQQIYNRCSTENLVTVKMSFPQTLDKVCPYMYRIVATPTAGGKKKVQYYMDHYYAAGAATDEIVSVQGLAPSVEYEIAVYPVNIWGIEGTPLRYTVTTAAASGR